MKTREKQAKPTEKQMVLRSPAKKPKPKAKPKKRPAAEDPRKPKKPPTAEDPRKPKKPPTAFFYFLEDFRKTFQEENPNVKSMREIGKACGEKWKTMPFEEKVPYYDIATVKRAEFEKAMAAFIKRKESGEKSEESDDYE